MDWLQKTMAETRILGRHCFVTCGQWLIDRSSKHLLHTIALKILLLSKIVVVQSGFYDGRRIEVHIICWLGALHRKDLYKVQQGERKSSWLRCRDEAMSALLGDS